jgi:WD repeat-containing protein 61
VSFSPDGKFIATGTHSGKINIIGVESGKKESVLDTRGKFIMSIAYVSLYHNTGRISLINFLMSL